MPHKANRGREASPRKAYDAGAKCRIVITDRLGGLGQDDETLLNRAIDAWLLMGTLGFRATRAAGSFVWTDESFPMPTTPLAYEDACRNLLDEVPDQAKVAVLEHDYAAAERARCDVSDSLGGRDRRDEQNDLARMHDPLGKVFGGRKTSPLKYRVLRFGDKFRILAFWDWRQNVTGNTNSDFYDVIDLLALRKPRIGEQLKEKFG